jgi:hypothetical protein
MMRWIPLPSCFKLPARSKPTFTVTVSTVSVLPSKSGPSGLPTKTPRSSRLQHEAEGLFVESGPFGLPTKTPRSSRLQQEVTPPENECDSSLLVVVKRHGKAIEMGILDPDSCPSTREHSPLKSFASGAVAKEYESGSEFDSDDDFGELPHAPSDQSSPEVLQKQEMNDFFAQMSKDPEDLQMSIFKKRRSLSQASADAEHQPYGRPLCLVSFEQEDDGGWTD